MNHDKNPLELAIRLAVPQDAKVLIHIQRDALIHSSAPFYLPNEIESWIAALNESEHLEGIQQNEVLVATVGDETVGFGHYKKIWEEIKELYVRPKFSKMGVGFRLLNNLETLARSQGIKVLRTFSTLNAVDFYVRVGFRCLEEKYLEVSKNHHVKFLEMEKDL